MTYDEAKKRLTQEIKEMEKEDSPIAYAAVVLDPEDEENYLLEFGLDDKTGGYFDIDKILDSNQKGTYQNDFTIVISNDGTNKNRETYNRTSKSYGNLLSGTRNIREEKKNKEKIRPLKAGISISDEPSKWKSGTIGAIFSVQEDDTHQYLLSNMHVLSFFNESYNEQLMSGDHNYIVQPSRADAYSLKYNHEDNIIGKTVWKKFDGVIDAAVAKINQNVPITPGFFNGGLKAKNNFTTKLRIDQAVHKYGRTTGFTESEIISLDAAIRVKNPYSEINGGRKYIVFKDQIMTNDMAAKGDSGSLLVNSGSQHPIGLTFGDIDFTNPFPNTMYQLLDNSMPKGRTFHNKLSNVFNSLSQESEGDPNNAQLTFKSFLT